MKSFITLISLVAARWDPNLLNRQSNNFIRSVTPTQWFENKVDHFTENSTATYQQRYWQDESAWNKTSGPVFIYICGEWTCSPESLTSYPFMVGAKHQALFLTLEHGYYGDSQPMPDWSTDNL